MTDGVNEPADDDVEMFYLPVAAIGFYDDPYGGYGNDGYDVATLKEEVIRDGEIQHPIAVGMSAADIAASGDSTIRSFDGNHRLAVARELGHQEILCENFWEDDAVPLTRSRILELGGRLVETVRPAPMSA